MSVGNLDDHGGHPPVEKQEAKTSSTLSPGITLFFPSPIRAKKTNATDPIKARDYAFLLFHHFVKSNTGSLSTSQPWNGDTLLQNSNRIP